MSKSDEAMNGSRLKRMLRKRMAELRDAMVPEEREERSLRACGHASSLMRRNRFKRLMIYVPFRSELDSRPLVEWAWEEGVEVLVPRSLPASRSMELYAIRSWDELVPGMYGIMEPDAKRLTPYEGESPDAVWTPGLAFDRYGGRLGYGGGYYDRLADRLGRDDRSASAEGRRKPLWLGLGYELQVVDHVPMERHDHRLDGLVTEAGIFIRRGFTAGGGITDGTESF